MFVSEKIDELDWVTRNTLIENYDKRTKNLKMILTDRLSRVLIYNFEELPWIIKLRETQQPNGELYLDAGLNLKEFPKWKDTFVRFFDYMGNLLTGIRYDLLNMKFEISLYGQGSPFVNIISREQDMITLLFRDRIRNPEWHSSLRKYIRSVIITEKQRHFFLKKGVGYSTLKWSFSKWFNMKTSHNAGFMIKNNSVLNPARPWFRVNSLENIGNLRRLQKDIELSDKASIYIENNFINSFVPGLRQKVAYPIEETLHWILSYLKQNA